MTRIRTGRPVYEPLSGRSVVCIGTAEWRSTLWTNQQHLMARLAARGVTVVYSESLGLRRPTVAARDLRRMARRLWSGLRSARRMDGVWVLSPLVLPVHGAAAARRLNAVALRAALGRALHRARAERPVLWAYNPHAHELAGWLDPEIVVYHCVDDIAAQEGVDEASFSAAERAIVARADLVIASARSLEARMRELGARRVAYLPNVADVGHFERAEGMPEPPELAGAPRPRLVFAGAVVAKKLEVGLLAELAARRADWTVVLVGPVGEGDPRSDLAALARLPNVMLVGRRAFEELPAWLGAADVALIPYAHNRYTASVFPMKVYEYLGAGLPVVSTSLPALRDVEGIAFADTVDEFEAAVEQALRQDGPEDRERRRAIARAHSWERRMDEIAELMVTCAER